MFKLLPLLLVFVPACGVDSVARKAAIEEVFSELNTVFDCEVVTMVETTDGDTDFDPILVISIDDLGKYTGWADLPNRTLKIDDTVSANKVTYILAHELGHIFGLEHGTTDQCFLMSEKPAYPLSSSEAVTQLKTCLEEKKIFLCQYKPQKVKLAL